MDLLTIRPLEQGDGYAVVGELDMASADELRSCLLEAPTTADLVLDLSALEFVDSSGLRVFLEAAFSRDNGSCVVLKNPSSTVAHVLEIAVPGGGPGLRIESSDGGSRNDGRATDDAR